MGGIVQFDAEFFAGIGLTALGLMFLLIAVMLVVSGCFDITIHEGDQQ